MRKTGEEFKAEVMKRCFEYKEKRRQIRKRCLILCLPVLLCAIIPAAVLLSEKGENQTMSSDSVCELSENNMIDNAYNGNESGDEASPENSYYTAKITVKTDPYIPEFDKLYTDPQKITEITGWINTHSFEDQETNSQKGVKFVITLTDMHGNDTVYTYISDNYAVDAGGGILKYKDAEKGELEFLINNFVSD